MRSRADVDKLRYTPALSTELGIPHWVDRAIEKAVHPDPEQRYEVTSEFTYVGGILMRASTTGAQGRWRSVIRCCFGSWCRWGWRGLWGFCWGWWWVRARQVSAPHD